MKNSRLVRYSVKLDGAIMMRGALITIRFDNESTPFDVQCARLACALQARGFLANLTHAYHAAEDGGPDTSPIPVLGIGLEGELSWIEKEEA